MEIELHYNLTGPLIYMHVVHCSPKHHYAENGCVTGGVSVCWLSITTSKHRDRIKPIFHNLSQIIREINFRHEIMQTFQD